MCYATDWRSGAGCILFGAKRLPELARSIGSSARELKTAFKEDDEKSSASQSGEAKDK